MLKAFSLGINKKLSIIFILTFTAVLILDSTIVKFSTYSDRSFPSTINFWIFITFCIIYGLGSNILLNFVKNTSSLSFYKPLLKIRYFYYIIFVIQTSILSITLLIILQMIFLQKYSIFLLNAATHISHLSALFFLIMLVFVFVSWLRSRRNHVMLLYTIAFSLIASNIIVSFIYLEHHFSRSLVPNIRYFPITFFVTQFTPSQWSESLSLIFEILSFSSFLAMWSATITLLYQYRYKLGRMKYFILMSLPLIYYLFPLEAYFGNIFSPLIQNSPISFGVTYTIIFSATKQLGALIFSLTFLTASSLVSRDSIRKLLLISAIGMAVLFGSIEITTLQYKIYPPFGLISESLMPIGAYLFFIGMFSTATSIAQDAQLRKDFYKSAKSQLTVLRAIGIRQMEIEMLRKFKSAQKRTSMLETSDQSYPEDEDIKEMVREVLKEVSSKNKEKQK